MPDPNYVNTPYTCDACVRVPPTWRYAVPDGTSPLKLMDTATGQVLEPWATIGGVGLCDECCAIVDKEGPLAPGLPERLGSRLVHSHPAIRGLPAERREFAKKGAISMWRRLLKIIATLPPPIPCVRGAHPMDGKMLRAPEPEAPGSGRGAEAN